MKEEELKQFVEKHGYIWLGLKRFNTHDKIVVKKGDVKIGLTLTKHIENCPLEDAKQWFPMEK